MSPTSVLKQAVLVCFILCGLPSLAFAAAPENDRFSVEVKGQGTHFDRSQNFKIANTGDWTALAILANGQGKENPLTFNQDHWGGGYEIAGTLLGEKVDWEFLFGQSFVQNRQKQEGLPGICANFTASHYYSMGFIDGARHGPGGTYGFFLSDASPVGARTLTDVELEYNMTAYEMAVHGVYHAAEWDKFQIGLIGGPVYSQYAQDYRFRTWGNNARVGGRSFSDTEEKLTDHLFGGHLGFLLKALFGPKVTVSVEQLFGGFLKYSRLNARQEIQHGEGTSDGASWTNDLNETIRVRDRDSGFVPQFSTRVETGIHVTRSILLSFFYQYDLWLNMSRIENPIVAADLSSIKNEPVGIKEDDDLSSHTIGGKLSLSF